MVYAPEHPDVMELVKGTDNGIRYAFGANELGSTTLNQEDRTNREEELAEIISPDSITYETTFDIVS